MVLSLYINYETHLVKEFVFTFIQCAQCIWNDSPFYSMQYALQYCQFLEEEHHTRKCAQLGSAMFSPMFFVILSFQKFCENDPWTLENWFSACALPTLVGLCGARKEFEAVD